MKTVVYEYPKCTTCQKAMAFLKKHQIDVDQKHIKEDHPSQEVIEAAWKKSGLPLKRFFNTSGMLYRELKLSEKLKQMSEAEQLALLASDGMLVKRPLLISDQGVLVGFKESEWQAFFNV